MDLNNSVLAICMDKYCSNSTLYKFENEIESKPHFMH